MIENNFGILFLSTLKESFKFTKKILKIEKAKIDVIGNFLL